LVIKYDAHVRPDHFGNKKGELAVVMSEQRSEQTSEPIRVIVIDDHPHARLAIRELLSVDQTFQIIAEGKNGYEAIELAEQYEPDLMIIDIQMPGLDGLEATKRIKDRFTAIKIVIVTVSHDVAHLFEALKKGAQGYLLKTLDSSLWLDYLRAIVTDDAPLSQEIAARILQEFTKAAETKRESLDHLTIREREVLECVAQGLSNKEIAVQLFISENTVKNHLKNIMHKLHADNRVQLSKYMQ
jgi:DNA-binding NarL/FixJ family response regulator